MKRSRKLLNEYIDDYCNREDRNKAYLSKRMGIRLQSFYNWYRGDGKSPMPFDRANQLCDIIGLPEKERVRFLYNLFLDHMDNAGYLEIIDYLEQNIVEFTVKCKV